MSKTPFLEGIAHSDHPTFEAVEAFLIDDDSGITVLVARYGKSDDFTGGRFVEAYCCNGELIDEDFGDANTPLSTHLATAVEEFAADYGY